MPEQIYLLYLIADKANADDVNIDTVEGDEEEADAGEATGFYYYDSLTGSLFPYIYLPLVIPDPTEPEISESMIPEPTEDDIIDPIPDMALEDLEYYQAEVDELQAKAQNTRVLIMVLAALLLISWLLFWFLTGRKAKRRPTDGAPPKASKPPKPTDKSSSGSNRRPLPTAKTDNHEHFAKEDKMGPIRITMLM